MSHDTEGPVAVRKPFNTLVASLCLPGLGHLYCGDLVAALAWATASAACGLLSIALLASEHLYTAWIPAIAVMVFATVHAWRLAARCPADYRLKRWNRWYVYVLFFAVCSVGGLGHAFVIRDRYVEAFVIVGDSMSPTISHRERVLADKGAYRGANVAVGDVVVFANPEKPQVTFVKRVVALAGDVVEIRAGQLFINDFAIESSASSETADFGPLTVPRYNCFVLGDNVNGSRDSRDFGPVPLASVRGKAKTIYWPKWKSIE